MNFRMLRKFFSTKKSFVANITNVRLGDKMNHFVLFEMIDLEKFQVTQVPTVEFFLVFGCWYKSLAIGIVNISLHNTRNGLRLAQLLYLILLKCCCDLSYFLCCHLEVKIIISIIIILI